MISSSQRGGKVVLGMKLALKVCIQPRGNTIYIKTGVGCLGQKAISIGMTILLGWPVLLTQFWGMLQQAELDNRVIAIAEDYIAHNQSSARQK